MALMLLKHQKKVNRGFVHTLIVAQRLFSERPQEKDRETIQGLPEAEDHHWEPSKPLTKTGQSNDENSYDDEEHSDPRAEISHKEALSPDPHERTQNYENPSKGAKEIYDEAPEEILEERPQEQYEDYEESYEENYEENPENHHTPEQVLSTLPGVLQTIANSPDASRSHPSEKDNHDVSSPNSPYSDLEDNVIPLEVLEAHTPDDGTVKEQVFNDSRQEEIGSQLSQIVDDKLNEGEIYGENLEHCTFLLFLGPKSFLSDSLFQLTRRQLMCLKILKQAA